ncbi:hypothetical protein HK101_008804 [Irineochytrium annulatum]|nr:hypothetical protein HK101_008804 [Irineochytrium annulatum]
MILPNALLALAAISAAAASKVDIFLNVDNDFVLTFNGGSPVVDATAQAPLLFNWQFTNHFTHTFADDEPLLIAIDASDNGVIAGIAAVVLVDGEVYAATDASDDNFLFSQQVVPGWNSNVNYDDSTWSAIADGKVGITCDQASLWGDVLTQLSKAANVPASLGVSMAWPGGCHNINTHTYVRLVIEPSSPAPAPAPVPAPAPAPGSSKVDVYLNIDNDFVLNFNGGSPLIDATAKAPQLFNWQFTNHFTYNVAANEPLLIAIDASDNGVIAGIAAVVLVDGKVYATTNAQSDNILFTQQVSAGWNSNINYDDSTWSTIASGKVGITCDQASLWGDVLTQLANEAKVSTSLGVAMAWPGGCHNVNTHTYVRIVIKPPSPAPAPVQAPTPIPSGSVYVVPAASTKAAGSNVYVNAAQPVKAAAVSALFLAPLLAVLLL